MRWTLARCAACTLPLLLATAPACGGRGQDDTRGSASGITSLTGGSTGDTTGTSSGGGTGVRLDVGNSGGDAGMSSAGDGGDTGCKKVDLLFVIDNSGSMEDEQQNLLASFPGFISSIQTTLADTDGYHVGVVTTDAYLFNEPGCTQEGALVTKTGGTGSSNATCSPFASGLRWMNEQDDLSNKFSCAAQVGTDGSGDERPMSAAIAALSQNMNAPGACNEGFLRDDALLVLVVITDEEDDHEVDGCNQLPQQGSDGEPAGWFQSIVAAKGGNEKNVVMLALVGPDGADACPPLDKCAGGIQGAEVATRILEFTNMFTFGFVGQVCAPSYDTFFQDAVSVIQSACDDFVPPG